MMSISNNRQHDSDWVTALRRCTNLIVSGRCGVDQALHPFMVMLSTIPSTLALSSPPTELTSSCPAPFPSIPSSMLRSVALGCMRLSVASGDQSRNAALLFRAAQHRGVVYQDSPQSALLTSERLAVPNIRSLLEDGQWEAACQLFHASVATDAGLAAGVEAYSAGTQWEEAVRLFRIMDRGSQTDRELACILGAMYTIARTTSKKQRQVSRHAQSDVDPLVEAEELWRTALALTSSFVDQRSAHMEWCMSHASRGSSVPRVHTDVFSSSAALSNLFGILGCFRRWEEALQVAFHHVQDAVVAPDSTLPTSSHIVSGLVRLNVVGLSQLCFALQSKWAIAMSLSSRLLQCGGVRFEELDAIAMQRVLKCCLSGHRWAEASRVVEAWRQRYHNKRSEGLLDVQVSEAAASTAPTIRMDQCMRLLQLLGSRPETRNARATLIQNHLFARATNTDIKSRAVNAMIQSCRDAQDAKQWSMELESLNVPEENESIAHRVQLCAQDGLWIESLRLCAQLLNDRCHKGVGSYIPTPSLHDWSQYAINSAPAPGPSWELSVSLFSRMIAAHVPLTDVSFQAVVRRCFSQGASQQASNVFALMMKRGVGRK